MKKNKLTCGRASRWKRFSYKSYAVFCSLKREVTIGTLSVATLFTASIATAKAQVETPARMKSYELEEIEVSGTRVPLTETESVKMVTVLSRADIQAAAVHSINDLLKYVAGVDVRQRGGFGVQTDISVRGGTSDQLTILLNGVNITNPQTGHHTAEFPVSLDDIERIEVLEGPSARVFGTSAFTGAINIVTRNDRRSHVSASAMGGSYGLFGAGARFNYTKGAISNQVSGDYKQSDGGTKNSDFKTTHAYYQGAYNSSQADVRWQFGLSDQKFGANTFYSAKFDNQYEELRRYMFSVQAETKGWLRFTPTVYWNRAQDHFQLTRGSANGENFHLSDVYGMNLNAHFKTLLGKTAFGAELRSEGILSTTLGKPLEEDQYVKVPGERDVVYTKKDNRTNVSYYLEHNILLRRWTLSMGVMANMNTALDHEYRFYPGIDIAYRPAANWKLFASWNKALRMPTFTDLYYQSENQQGNVGLKPEKTEAFNLGGRYRNAAVDASLSLFYHKGKNMIDWVQYSADDKYHSANFELDNMGVETSVTLFFRQIVDADFFVDKLNVSYAFIHQKRHDDVEIFKSNYAMEYLRHKLVVRLDHRIWKKLDASWAFRWQDRVSSPSFGLLDLKLSWNDPRLTVFAEANNLFDRNYYDYGNIPQPGIWINGGIKYRIDL